MTTAPALIDACPRRAPALRVGPAVLRGERVVHLVKDTRSGKFFELGVKEEFVVARLDGATTLREIGEQYAAAFGRALDDAAWGQILGALHRKSFLDVPRARVVPVVAPEQPRNWRLATASWGDPSRVLDRWEPRLRWMFHPVAAVLVALVCLGLLGYLVVNAGTMRHELPVLWRHPELAVLAFMLIWVSSALHEFAHGLVCHHYGGRATDIGVRWRAPMVVFYCEADDVLVLRTRRGQVLTAAAGVIANLVFLLPFFALYLVLPRGEVTHDALAGLLVFGILRAVVNYLPLPELDGYQMVQHGWAVTGLAKQTWRYVRGDRSAYPARAKRIYPLYALIFVLSWCAVLAAGVALLVTATSGVARVVVLAVSAAWLALTVAVSVLRRRRPRAPMPPPDPSPPPAERNEPPMPVQPETTPETRATTQAAPVLVVEDLHKTYGDVVAVAGTSLTVHEGEFFGILGPNGAGKTTLIEIMEGQRTPDSGTVTVFGSSPWPRSVEINRRIGVQTQASSFFPQLTALEHLETVAGLYALDRSAAAEALADVGLSESAKVLVTKLSGGQRQRLAIASALVHKPDLLFLDEPTAALDPKSRRDLWGLLRDISERGCSIVYTTHHLDEAEALCDRVAIIRDGGVIALDSPRELIRGAGAKSKVVVPGALLDLDAAQAMEGVESARKAGDDVEITTAAVSKVLAALGSTVDLGEVETRRPTLEDVYLDLTGAEYQP